MLLQRLFLRMGEKALRKWLDQMEEKMGEVRKPKMRLRLLLLMGLIGVMVLLLSSFFQANQPTEGKDPSFFQKETPSTNTTEVNQKMDRYEKEYESELAEILSQIVGVDDVSVVVNLDSTEEDIIYMDQRNTEQVTTEMDTKGGNRSIRNETDDRKPAFYQDRDGEKPLIVKKLKPKIRGILVVARGVENLQVKAAVIEAIQRTLDVPVHRISVLPKG